MINTIVCGDALNIQRIWAMPNKWTFTIKPIRELLKEEMNGGEWIDPFCGKYSRAEVKNDLNPNIEAGTHTDALIFLRLWNDEWFDGCLFDPPYSLRQAQECYKNYGGDKLEPNVSNMRYWRRCKDEIARILKIGGKVISFGWNSNGIGKKRGFSLERLLLVPHGGGKNDTIVTVETKISHQYSLQELFA